jgi:hypothetical protein
MTTRRTSNFALLGAPAIAQSSPLHWHPAAIRWRRTSKHLDKAKTSALRAGDFFIVPAGEAHYEGSDGECLIIGAGLSGWKTADLY